MREPAVSVIMPVYNVAGFVRAAVESVLSQSWTDLELIIVDDGSTDGTAREIAEIDDRRVAFVHIEHSGVAQARNAALRALWGRMASCPAVENRRFSDVDSTRRPIFNRRQVTNPPHNRYIAFLDGDDLWAPGILERQVEFLEANPSVILSFSSMKMIDESGRDLGRSILGWSGTLNFSGLLTEDVIPTSTVVMRREVADTVGLFDEELQRGSDHDYWLRVALAYPTGLFGFPEVGVLYRRRAEQLTADWRLKEQAWRQLLTKMLRMAPVEAAGCAARASANLDRALAAIAYENGELRPALQLFRRALKHAPWFLICDKRTWLLGAALLSACLLPTRIHQRAEQWFRTARAYRT
ncbi:MAG TPA: glycosyltransferase [Bryobacteraceae bacterium]